MTNEKAIDIEVRVRVLEKIAEKIDFRFDNLDSQMKSQFHWIMATLFLLIITMVGFFATIALHALELI